jgi:hypothetical protein
VQVRVTKAPTYDTVDGIPLGHFRVGCVYGLPAPLATLMIVEGWAVPVTNEKDVTLPSIAFMFTPVQERRQRMTSSGLRRDRSLAAERRRRH